VAEASGGEARIAAAFSAARERGGAALMPYLVGGFPDHQSSLTIADCYAEAGADLVELGVPFSDPLADGPVIQDAATRAIEAGATLGSVLRVCERVADRLPVVLMVYANMVVAGGGPQSFARRAADAGAAGAIVPDLPFDEAAAVRDALGEADLATVPLVAPTTEPERRRQICAAAQGFVYVVSDVGTTGERAALPAALSELVTAVRAEAAVPAAVGFGIGTPEQAAEVGRIADGVIIGSRLVRLAAEAGNDCTGSIAEFLRETRDALRRG
jgi:tryptophan synthase alpha chain